MTTETPEVIEVIAAVAEAPEAVAEVTTDTAETAETPEGDKPADEAPAKRDGVQRRIDELTWKAKEAQRQADHWQRVATENAQGATEPDPDAFDDPASYARAIAKWEAKHTVATERQETANLAATDARMQAWEARQADFSVQTPDYQKIVGSSEVPIAGHIADALMDSDFGPQLAYKLATDPDLAARLNGMSPNRALIEVGRIEASLSAPAVRAPSNAPPPPTPIAASRNNTVDLGKADMDSYVAERRKQGARY